MSTKNADNEIFKKLMSVQFFSKGKINDKSKEANIMRRMKGILNVNNLSNLATIKETFHKTDDESKLMIMQTLVNIYKKTDDTGKKYLNGKDFEDTDELKEMNNAKKLIHDKKQTVSVKYDGSGGDTGKTEVHDDDDDNDVEILPNPNITIEKLEKLLPAKPFDSKIKNIPTKALGDSYRKMHFGMGSRNVLSNHKVKLTLF
jgi:hypothetical protein